MIVLSLLSLLSLLAGDRVNWARVQADRTLIATAVEETVRLSGGQQGAVPGHHP